MQGLRPRKLSKDWTFSRRGNDGSRAVFSQDHNRRRYQQSPTNCTAKGDSTVLQLTQIVKQDSFPQISARNMSRELQMIEMHCRLSVRNPIISALTDKIREKDTGYLRIGTGNVVGGIPLPLT
ncbi:hypothetical protein TNCV_2275591 [Trichonephila clavipes]|nr:hypothetical protein TNCV_2275591 [Trichonephila clavipes]